MKGTIMINVRDFEHLLWNKKYDEIVEVLEAHPIVKRRFVRYYGEEVPVERMARIMCTMLYKDVRGLICPDYYG